MGQTKNNNEIKFRVWDKVKKKFLPSILNGFYVDTGDDVGPPCFECTGDLISIGELSKIDGKESRYVVQQYIQIDDIYGKHIYIGDIVQYNNNSIYDGVNFEVKENDYGLGFTIINNNNDILGSSLMKYRYSNLEVVGNIFT